MLTGTALVVDVQADDYTDEKGKTYYYSTLKLALYDAEGNLGDFITVSGVAGLTLPDIGKYTITATVQQRERKTRVRVLSMAPFAVPTPVAEKPVK